MVRAGLRRFARASFGGQRPNLAGPIWRASASLSAMLRQARKSTIIWFLLAGLGHHPDIQSQQVGRDNILSLVAVGRWLTLTSEPTTVARFPESLTGNWREVLPFSMVWSPRNDNPLHAAGRGMARAMGRSAISRPLPKDEAGAKSIRIRDRHWFIRRSFSISYSSDFR